MGKKVLLVFLGSGFGGSVRYLLGGWVQKVLGGNFPYGTLAINAMGSFLIGIIMHLGIHTDAISPQTRLALTTGVLGGFTTYSTFNYETVSLFQRGAALLGVLNVFITVFTCLGVGALGLWVARWAVA